MDKGVKLYMNEMIYDFKTHSLTYRVPGIDVLHFSLAIDTLELIFELYTGKLLGVQGFFPLIKADVCNIDFPQCKLGDYRLNNIDLSIFKKDEVYDLIEKIPQTKKYFEKMSVKYDKSNRIIQIGENLSEGENLIKVNNNIVCGLDKNLDLRCVYIMPEDFIP